MAEKTKGGKEGPSVRSEKGVTSDGSKRIGPLVRKAANEKRRINGERGGASRQKRRPAPRKRQQAAAAAVGDEVTSGVDGRMGTIDLTSRTKNLSAALMYFFPDDKTGRQSLTVRTWPSFPRNVSTMRARGHLLGR